MSPWLARGLRGVLGAAVLTAAIAAAAVAYWTGGGHGSAEARLSHPDSLALTPGTPDEYLYPGGSADVALVAANPNSYSVRIGSLVLDTSAGSGGFEVDAGHSGCDVSALAFAAQDNDGAGWVVPPDGSLPIALDGALTMGSDAADACQGAVFTVHLVAGS